MTSLHEIFLYFQEHPDINAFASSQAREVFPGHADLERLQERPN